MERKLNLILGLLLVSIVVGVLALAPRLRGGSNKSQAHNESPSQVVERECKAFRDQIGITNDALINYQKCVENSYNNQIQDMLNALIQSSS
jgi:hypothetical protein